MRSLAAGIVIVGMALVAAPPEAGAGTYYVNNSSPYCSDAGPGSQSTPYCTISAALAAQHAPGTTIVVLPGNYREEVAVPASGVSGSPIVLQAQVSPGSAVVVDGADDFANPALWVPYSGHVWLAASVTWSPKQVFADSARLAVSKAAPGSLPVNGFVWASGAGLYVNVGGDNPGTHHAEVGHRLYGFHVSGRSWVEIDRFTATRSEWAGVELDSHSSQVAITHVVATFSSNYGIQVDDCTAALVASNATSDHLWSGIALTGGTTGCTVQDNESFHNLTPDQACGLYAYGSPGNWIQRNQLHDNAYNGIFLSTGAANNVLLQNRSWSNGHHGIEDIFCTGNFHVGDVSYGNAGNGFAIEGSATGTTLYDCIAIASGLAAGTAALEVDASSMAGFTSNDNVFWNSAGGAVVLYGRTSYGTISDYSAASGQDTRSLRADPRFVNPAVGDFHLMAGSPAIDGANSGVAHWPSADAEGNARIDDPGVPNTGLGPITYADRGALEFQPAGTPNQPPVAVLTLGPSSGYATTAVTADASASFDPDGGMIVSYRFDFGDGTGVGPQSGATATHVYATGHWTVTITVTDSLGGTGWTSSVVPIAPERSGANLVGNPSFETDLSGWASVGSATPGRALGGYEGSYSLQLSAPLGTPASYGVTDQPAWVSSTPAAGTRYRCIAWLRSGSSRGRGLLTLRESRGKRHRPEVQSSPITLSPSWDFVTLDYVTYWAGSSLSLQILDQPVAAGESFLADAVTIVTKSAASAPVPPATSRAAVGGASPLADLTARVTPDPVVTTATLSFTLSRPGPVRIQVFDLCGRVVRILRNGSPAVAGWNVVRIDGRADDGAPLRAGVYLYEIRAGAQRAVGRFVVMR